MEPVEWARTIVANLETKGVVGALLPTGVGDAADRYQPNRVFANYAWSGNPSAGTLVEFVVKPARGASAQRMAAGDWNLTASEAPAGWNAEYRLIQITIPPSGPITRTEDFVQTNQFKVRLAIEDSPIGEGTYSRRISLQNLRQTGGTLFRIRIVQENVPNLVRVRAHGVGDDIYYRAGGLVGTFDRPANRLSFQPFALLPEPIRRPLPGPSVAEAVASGVISRGIGDLATANKITTLFKFQVEAIQRIGTVLESNNPPTPLLLTGGTGAGKTEAFLFPLLSKISPDVPRVGVQGLFVYPTKALAADQCRRMFEYLAAFNRGRSHPITIGVFDGDTPSSFDEVARREAAGTLLSPFSECPAPGCGGPIRFARALDGSRLECPICSRCGVKYPWLRIDRKSIRERWPHLYLTNPDMLHRKVSDSFAFIGQTTFGRGVHHCLSCGKYTVATRKTVAAIRSCECGMAFSPPASLTPLIAVFDEAHLFKGLFGSQVSLLIARIRKIVESCAGRTLFLGASATIASPDEFGKQLFGSPVGILRGQDELNREEAPTRFHLFILPVQVSVLNAVGHVLTGCFLADQAAGETNRVLVFSDSKRTVYQLEASLPEFYAGARGSDLPGDWATPRTRSHTGDLSREQRRVVESAFDSSELRVLLATQTLEVGVDFSNLQLELQTGATYSYNDYIQRVGRAGRKGVPALVACILRPQVPLDYYYYEHCRELVEISEETLDEIPIRADNPFLVERHAPAAIQDFIINAEANAGLMWNPAGALQEIRGPTSGLRQYLEEVFIKAHSWDADLLKDAIKAAISKVQTTLATPPGGSRVVSEILAPLIPLTLRASDLQIEIGSEDYSRHQGISLAGEMLEGEGDGDDEDEEEPGGPE